jgi:hypothetical protein
MELRLELPLAVEYQELVWVRLQGRGPHPGERNDRLVAPGMADVVASRDGQRSSESTEWTQLRLD